MSWGFFEAVFLKKNPLTRNVKAKMSKYVIVILAQLILKRNVRQMHTFLCQKQNAFSKIKKITGVYF